MDAYEIAGLKVHMTCSGKTARQAAPYRAKEAFTAPDICLSVTEEQLEALKRKHPQGQLDWEYFALSNLFASAVVDHNGMILHASAVVLDGQAYLFSAPSGTGKSTHAALWVSIFPGAFILNDDKPVIRYSDDRFLACGTPFSGKTDTSTNTCVPLKAICILTRGPENRMCSLSPGEALPFLFRQTLRFASREKTEALLSFLDRLLKAVPVYELVCLPDREAALLAREVMSK